MADAAGEERDGLTRNQRLVLDALEAGGGPRSAYGLLDALRDEGLKAPQQVYRALTRLVETGLVHRIESMNAYVACCRPGAHGDGASVFLICRACEGAEEMTDRDTSEALGRLCARTGFLPEKRTVEVHGLCRACACG